MKAHTSITNEKKVNDSSSSKILLEADDFSAFVNAYACEMILKRCIKVRTLKESLPTQQQQNQTPHTDVKQPIRFSTIEIREYPRMLGDNPSATQGPPVTIDWIPTRTYSLSVDEYEQSRPRNKIMITPRSVRREWLREEGYSRGEMKEAEQIAVNVRKGREDSMKESVKVEALKEFLARKYQKWFLHKPSAKFLYEDWMEQHQDWLKQHQERLNDDTLEPQLEVVSRVA